MRKKMWRRRKKKKIVMEEEREKKRKKEKDVGAVSSCIRLLNPHGFSNREVSSKHTVILVRGGFLHDV